MLCSLAAPDVCMPATLALPLGRPALCPSLTSAVAAPEAVVWVAPAKAAPALGHASACRRPQWETRQAVASAGCANLISSHAILLPREQHASAV